MRTIEQIADDLRKEARSSLVYLGLLAGGALLLIPALWLSGKDPDLARGQWTVLPFLLLIAGLMSRRHIRTLRTQLTSEGVLLRRIGRDVSLRWQDVSHVSLESRKIELQGVGGSPKVVIHSHHPDELYGTVCFLVPRSAFETSPAG